MQIKITSESNKIDTWITVDNMSTEEIEEAIIELYQAGDENKEDLSIDELDFLVTGYDDFGPIDLGEKPCFEEIATLLEMIELHGENALYVAEEVGIDHVGDAYDRDCGEHESFLEYASQYADDMIENDTLKTYFDYDRFASDLEHDYTVIELPCGNVLIFHA